ncbi:unnamed protein product [Urochloa decumbens]|uniref:VQ domain-containing protein n=1 Tax=Urochloa decumbens TaxID=240449 RepID=A0ABC9CZU1_9POAL
MPSHQSPPLMQQRHQQGLVGPRPATLKVSSTTNKKEKQPVIIYVESPKVVHAHPSEFKSVVQRLTGAPLPPTAPPLQFPFQLPLAVATEQAPLHAAASSVVVRSLGLYDHHYQSQSTVNPPPPPSLGACYHRHGDLFVNLH